MNKSNTLKLFGFASILILVILLAVTNFAEPSQKPPAVNWGVQIPATSVNLSGISGYTYVNTGSGSDVYVQVEKKNYNYTGEKGFYYGFKLQLRNPDIWAAFQNVKFSKFEFPDNKPYCVFPEGCDSLSPPICMECFLNKTHPRPGYSSMFICFMIYNIDIEAMPYNVPYQASGRNSVTLSIEYPSDCILPPLYHDIWSMVRNGAGLYITRTGLNTWRIDVSNQDFYITEQYCQQESTGKGKTTKTIIYYPLAGWASISFQMDFIKNPS